MRSPHPHARVLSIDLDPALALPGVRAAVELLGKERLVRYVGQEVAAVAAVDRHTAERALALVRVGYEPLPAAIGAGRRAPRGRTRRLQPAPQAAAARSGGAAGAGPVARERARPRRRVLTAGAARRAG